MGALFVDWDLLSVHVLHHVLFLRFGVDTQCGTETVLAQQISQHQKSPF